MLMVQMIGQKVKKEGIRSEMHVVLLDITMRVSSFPFF